MKRTKVLLMALAGLGGMLLLAGSSQGQGPGGAGAPPGAGAAPSTGPRPVIAVFNMAAVMREFGQAKYQVHILNEKRKSLSTQVVAWRAEYVKYQEELPKQQVPSIRDDYAKKMLELSRKIQDQEATINKTLNDEATIASAKTGAGGSLQRLPVDSGQAHDAGVRQVQATEEIKERALA